MKLERMEDFFSSRVVGYDEHMRTTIEGATDFYAYTASLMPVEKDARILDATVTVLIQAHSSCSRLQAA